MASFTITTTSAEDARIVVAMGKYLNLVDVNGTPRDATGAEVKQYIVDHLKAIVRSIEVAAGEQALRDSFSDIAPT